MFRLFELMYNEQKYIMNLSYAIVYQKHGTIIGVALVAENETYETLKLILVLPQFRNKGIGGKIVDFFIAECELTKEKFPRISFQTLNVDESEDIFFEYAKIFVKRGFTTKKKSLDNLETYLELPF